MSVFKQHVLAAAAMVGALVTGQVLAGRVGHDGDQLAARTIL